MDTMYEIMRCEFRFPNIFMSGSKELQRFSTSHLMHQARFDVLNGPAIDESPCPGKAAHAWRLADSQYWSQLWRVIIGAI